MANYRPDPTAVAVANFEEIRRQPESRAGFGTTVLGLGMAAVGTVATYKLGVWASPDLTDVLVSNDAINFMAADGGSTSQIAGEMDNYQNALWPLMGKVGLIGASLLFTAACIGGVYEGAREKIKSLFGRTAKQDS